MNHPEKNWQPVITALEIEDNPSKAIHLIFKIQRAYIEEMFDYRKECIKEINDGLNDIKLGSNFMAEYLRWASNRKAKMTELEKEMNYMRFAPEFLGYFVDWAV